jgi:uncharacterized protein YbbC (DUF1343 family)
MAKPVPSIIENPLPLEQRLKANKDGASLKVGAERTAHYIPLLQDMRIAVVVNQTSMAGKEHLVDLLLRHKIKVVKIFAPEHGFRGEADAGAHISSGVDIKTLLPIVSLYGDNKKPSPEQLADIDLVLFDIQDVGARFYTYISTMHYVMQACAENDKICCILDRPNPNGFYVDGPVLQPELRSFVGMHPIPIVHGMTIGEFALMINEEGWLGNNLKCKLAIVPCEGYDHSFFYEPPIKPSPNLPNIRSIYLYPSLCLFEGTIISVGRGTDKQFQVIGAPNLSDFSYQFTPTSKPGAQNPLYQNSTCNGLDLSNIDLEILQSAKRINLQWLIQFYHAHPQKEKFFLTNNFIDKLWGNTRLRQQIIKGISETEIRASWQPDLDLFKMKRQQYLIYSDVDED